MSLQKPFVIGLAASAAVLLYLIANAIGSIPYLLWIQRRKAAAQNQVKG